ncbi:MAG: glycoside hydrolase family 2 TIM barrel-domain containing protein, partial [Eubacteriales bacterium]|nr:glycoside hydrolase family 2 TIM barrel-domain containing protein [Eubacteriales bacterium]
NDGWRYLPSYSEGMERTDADESAFIPVRLPHTNQELPLNNFDERDSQFVSCYRKRISWVERAGKRVFLRFEGVMTAAKVYLDGAFQTEHIGGYTPFSCELTGKLKTGEHVIAVVVDSRELSDIPPFGYVIDYLTYGGIYREVWLEETDDLFVKNAQIKPEKSDGCWRVNTDVFLDNALGISGQAELQFALNGSDGDGATLELPVSLSGETNQTVKASFDAGDVRLWDIDEPNLYEMTISLSTGDMQDKFNCRFGFREAKFTPEGFYLNGKKRKLRGLNRHQSYPYVGYAMPKSAQVRDAELLKRELGVNLVRTSHYPQSNHFLNRCDELGLLVFEEIPGWQHIGGETWKQNTMTALQEMITRDWNHPSIILWGVRINESQDDDAFYEATNNLAHRLDATRQTGGVRNFENSHFLEDVYTYNDFLHNGVTEPLKKPEQVTSGRVPYLVTEHNGHMFPTKKFDCEERRVEQALRHLRVLDRMYGSPGIAGAVGWCMSDYNTHKDFGSGDKICYHGVTDLFRLPKIAAAVYRSQQDESVVMEVASGMHQGERAGSDLGCVCVFTNCDTVRLYKNGDYISTYTPDHATYSSIPHPPVVITDFIGDLLMRNEGFTIRDADRIKRVFAAIVRYGDKSLPLRFKIAMGYAMLKHRYSYEDALGLYMRYVAGWGSESTEYLFEGYRGDTLVSSIRRGASFTAGLKLTPDTLELIEGDTYDVCRVVMEHIDQFGAVMTYSSEAVRVRVSGAGERIGPELVSLLGGSSAFWVKTTREGEILVSVESERFGRQELTLRVSRASHSETVPQ